MLSDPIIHRTADRTKPAANAFADLPPRWRALLSRSDDRLAQDRVRPPLHDRRDLPFRAKGERPLPEQLMLLQRDHVGMPVVTLAHAALIVLIRRESHLKPALQRYFALWDRHEDLLLKSLTLRWLVSAADTLADHGRDPTERLAGLAVALFVNTVKLYETERARTGPPRNPNFAQSNKVAIDLDGILGFRVARGDTVGNMMKRKDRVLAELAETAQGLPGRLLDQVILRVNRLDTVYARFRRLHETKVHNW